MRKRLDAEKMAVNTPKAVKSPRPKKLTDEMFISTIKKFYFKALMW